MAPPLDSDRDGMPDSWERAHGLRPLADDSATIAPGNSYTNIETYLNELSAKTISYDVTCMVKSLASAKEINIVPFLLPTLLQDKE